MVAQERVSMNRISLKFMWNHLQKQRMAISSFFVKKKLISETCYLLHSEWYNDGQYAEQKDAFYEPWQKDDFIDEWLLFYKAYDSYGHRSFIRDFIGYTEGRNIEYYFLHPHVWVQHFLSLFIPSPQMLLWDKEIRKYSKQ